MTLEQGRAGSIATLADKNFKEMNIGIAVSTYTEEKTEPERYEIIDRSLKSLKKIMENTKNIHVVIVVDGEVPNRHNDILEKYVGEFAIHRRSRNGGVARTKNTSIRLLLEKGVDIGFLADDDVLYRDGCIRKYCETIARGRIHHMGFSQMHPTVHPEEEWRKFGYVKENLNGQDVMRHGGGGVGCWLSFTPELIEKIGYFKVMTGKYGYEHINFSKRCMHHGMIPYCCDITNPFEYIDHIGFEPVGHNKFKKSHSISEEVRVAENNKNKNEWKADFDKYVCPVE